MAKKPKSAKAAKAGKGKPGRPRKAAAGQSAAPGAAAAPSSPNKAQVVRKVITEGKLTALMRTCTSLKKQGETLNGSLREKIAYAVEHDYLNKEVFALIRRLDRKEPESLAIFLDDLEHYIEISGLGDRADSVQNLSLEGGSNPGPKKDKTGGNPRGRSLNGNGAQATANGSAEHESEAGEGDEPDNVSRPQFGAATGQAPGGPVHVLPDAPGKH